MRVSRRWESEQAPAPLVSIIIPCYNQAHFLGEAIESGLTQTYPHHEIIVVDDGSMDATREVASSYPGVQCVRQDNAGLSAARNTGVRVSRGQFLVFLDADDRLLPNALQSGLSCFKGYPECAFVSGHFRYINSDGSVRLQFPQEELELDPYQALLQRNYISMHATVMYRRKVVEAVGGFTTSLQSCEDYDMYLRIVRTHDVHRHDGVVAEYRSHEGSMSMDPARMLRGVMATLAAQWPYISGDAVQIRAYRTGIRNNRRSVRLPLLSYLRRSVEGGRWLQTGFFLWKLAEYAPVWLSAAWLDARLTLRLIIGKRPSVSSDELFSKPTPLARDEDAH